MLPSVFLLFVRERGMYVPRFGMGSTLIKVLPMHSVAIHWPFQESNEPFT
jgi:hypothetical protein